MFLFLKYLYALLKVLTTGGSCNMRENNQIIRIQFSDSLIIQTQWSFILISPSTISINTYHLQQPGP